MVSDDYNSPYRAKKSDCKSGKSNCKKGIMLLSVMRLPYNVDYERTFTMRFIFLILSFILVCKIGAQERAVVDVRFKKMDLPPITSSSFFFSSENLLWFSTSQGLTSFDGIETHSYYPDTSQTINLGLSGILAIAEDKNKNLWIAGREPGLIHFNTSTKKCTVIRLNIKKATIFNGTITRLFFDKKGLLWISTLGCGFYIYNTTDSTIEHFNFSDQALNCDKKSAHRGTPSMTPHFKDPDKMWLGSSDGIFLFDRNTKQIQKKYEFKKTAKIHDQFLWATLYLDAPNDSILCIGTTHYGMGIFNIKENSMTLIPPDWSAKTNISPYPTSIDHYLFVPIGSIEKKSADEYWVSFADSLPVIFNIKTKKYSYLQSPDFQNPLQEAFYYVIKHDRKENLWLLAKNNLYFVSNELNLFKSQNTPFVAGYTGDETGLSDLIWDDEMKCYHVTYRYLNKIYQLDSNFNMIGATTTTFPPNDVYRDIKLVKDGQKRIWSLIYRIYGGDAVSENISVYSQKDKQFILPQKISPQLTLLHNLVDITADKQGNLIFSKANGDLFFLNSKTLKIDSLLFPKVDSSDQFEFIESYLHYDVNFDRIYVSNKKNLLQFDVQKKEKRIITPKNLLSIRTGEYPTFYFDEDGQVWVFLRTKYRKEIYIYEGDTFQFKKKVILKNSKNETFNVNTLRPGPHQYMFIDTDEGVIAYNYRKGTFSFVDKNNGLLYNLRRRIRYVNDLLILGNGDKVQHVSFNKLLSLTNERNPRINRVTVYSKKDVSSLDFSTNRIQLNYKQNTIGISFSAMEYLFPERIQYAYRLSRLGTDWQYSDQKSREIVYSNLAPGKYVFQLKAQILGGNWQQSPLELYITITPPFWQTWWFRVLAGLLLISLAFFFIRWRIALVRKKEQLKSLHEKELLELEAKALRAQMNPHFIFNSLNSIKSLINKNENDKAANYLTTFSKLIRTLFQNSDKREVSLFEEIETCKLYTELEQMRFGDKIEFIFNVDEKIDLKDIKVPALILQPLIENAIWHGVAPKETGGQIVFSVKENDDAIECIIDDDGIGRELSNQYKTQYRATHQSKGIGMTQSRLELDKILNEREDTVEIIDKIDSSGNSSGTKVILTFKERQI